MEKWIGPRPPDRLLQVVCSACLFAPLAVAFCWHLWRDVGRPTTADWLWACALTIGASAATAVVLRIHLEELLRAYGVRLSRQPDQGRDYREVDRPTPPDGL